MKMNHIKQKYVEKGFIGFITFCITSIIYFICTYIYKTYLYLFVPVKKNQLLFISTPDYADNAYAFYKYMQNHYKNQYDYIWLISKSYPELPSDTIDTHFIRYTSKRHRYQTLKAIKSILTSEYIFYTHISPMQTLKKRNKQSIINLWHGCGYKAHERTASQSKQTDNRFDYVLVPGKEFIATKQKFWGCVQEAILPIGYPRYDQLFIKSDTARQYAIDIKQNANTLVIWMPTFRKTKNNQFPEESITYNYDLPILHSIDSLKELDFYCKQFNIKLCIKRHILQIDYEEENIPCQNIVFIDNDDIEEAGIQLYEILPYTDALISDYSSIAVDYLLLDKPIGFCLDDFEQYKSTRGFVFDDPLTYMPGTHIYTFEDLIQFLADVATDKDPYTNERHEMMTLMHNPCNNYCERIWQTIQALKEKMIMLVIINPILFLIHHQQYSL